MNARRLEGEWLDELPAEDPRARRSRSDLRRVNGLMGNARIVVSALRRGPDGYPRSVVEIGAGDGAFALRLARLMGARDMTVTLVDRQDIVGDATRAAFERVGARVHAERADIFAWLEGPGERVEAIVANLFLHHFDDAGLSRMLALIARRASTFVACEPRRCAIALAGARMLGAIGCNDVTRHDSVASVRAGFRGRELSALWPAGPWTLREESRGLFSHLFAATRTGAEK
jgi:SAM-dependent methyltransferase